MPLFVNIFVCVCSFRVIDTFCHVIQPYVMVTVPDHIHLCFYMIHETYTHGKRIPALLETYSF